MIPDVLDATVAYLESYAEIVGLTGLRVFPGEMPLGEPANQPRGAIVVRQTGGIGRPDSVPMQSVRVDATCYAATPKQARQLYGMVYTAFVELRRATHAGCLLSSAVQSGGPIDGRNPDTHAPMVWSSWTVNASTIAVVQ